MENRNFGHISGTELDQLLNESFLNLDFENNAGNEKVLDAVAKSYTAKKNIFSQLFTAQRIDLFILFLSALVFLNSFYRFIEKPSSTDENRLVPDPVVISAGTAKSPSTFNEKKNANLIPKTAVHQATKNKKYRRFKKNHQRVVPVTPVIIKKSDTLSEYSGSNPVVVMTENLPTTGSTDSSGTVRGDAPVPLPVTTKRKIRPARDSISITAKKGRKELKRKKYLFHKDGILIMRGSSYRKSRLH